MNKEDILKDDEYSYVIKDTIKNIPEEDFQVKSVKELLALLGYKDPMPSAGKWNKKAMKLRAKEAKKYKNALKKSCIGNRNIYEDGGYMKKKVYLHNNVLYI